jgi:hypothetical protein
MALERRWTNVPSRQLVQDGGEDGLIVLEDTIYLKVKQKIKLSALGEPDRVLEVKRVASPTRLYVGPDDKNINSRQDISAYTVAKISTVSAEEQTKRVPGWEDQYAHSYEQEPILARRVIQVDPYGDFYTIQNPLPVQLSDGSINIGSVNAELQVQLTHLDNDPNPGDVHDSIRVGDGENQLSINSDGSINTVVTVNGYLENNPSSVNITGSIDGTENSVKYGFVNNVKNQILAAHDREQEIVYADFGTKNQRVVEIIYTSDTFPLVEAKKTFTYTLVGNRYRRDTITWSVT